MEHAAPQERVRELLLVVARDDDDRTLFGHDLVTGLAHDESHPVDLVQEVVRELEIGFVDLVDEENDALFRLQRATEGPELDVAPDVFYALGADVTEASVVETLHGVVDVETVLRPRRRFHGPVNQLEAEGLGDRRREQGLPGSGFPLHEKGALEDQGRVDGSLQPRIGK